MAIDLRLEIQEVIEKKWIDEKLGPIRNKELSLHLDRVLK